MQAMEAAETIEAKTEGHGFWTTVKESLAGSQQDYTEGSLGRAVLLLAVPMILEMSMESLFGILDVFWVGRLGAAADAHALVALEAGGRVAGRAVCAVVDGDRGVQLAGQPLDA